MGKVIIAWTNTIPSKLKQCKVTLNERVAGKGGKNTYAHLYKNLQL